MKKRWTVAISDAHAAVREHRDVFVRFVRYFNSQKCESGDRIADALNAELKSILLSAFVCENVLREIKLAVAKRDFDTEELHNFAHVFGTYAVIACFNSLKIFQSKEICGLILNDKQQTVVAIFNSHIPRIIDAGDAIRHHHDRIFSRVRDEKVGANPFGQLIAHWGPELKLTDKNMNEFYFKFPSASILAALCEIIEALEK